MSNYVQSPLLPEPIEDWDPLSQGKEDPTLIVAAQRREIRNILKSYTGYYDLFAEMIQNSLDAVDRRTKEAQKGYQPTIWILVDMYESVVSVTDNGIGMTLSQFQQFMKPNFSFKDGKTSRGNKGVGATFLAYGFNYLEVATKTAGRVFSGVLQNGREWVEDKTETIGTPKVTRCDVSHTAFLEIDRGTSMTLQLTGNHIRPKNLAYNGAENAKQWMSILRVTTPLGGIYICSDARPAVRVILEVVDLAGNITTEILDKSEYIYPHLALGTTADLREYLEDQEKRLKRGQDVSKPSPRFTKLNGLWGEWAGDEIINDKSPIKPRLDDEEIALLRELGLTIYVFLGYSTELWDYYNDKVLELRKGLRLLRGGLQLATRNMPQGQPITIPLTENIGYQNVSHVIVHFDNAEPDLGRKGFQPEVVRLAERLSVSAVSAFKRYQPLLRSRTGAPALQEQMKLDQWIEEQKKYEVQFPLVITGTQLFLPTEELPIRSMPRVEQDVVALFNQMLSSGIVRGVQILSTSQYKQYDGLFRIKLEPPFAKYIYSSNNPLGIDKGIFSGAIESIISKVQVLEYKYILDDLIEEFQTGEKNPDEINLVIAWEVGTMWKADLEIVSYLDERNVHLRTFHGFTHAFYRSGQHHPVFEAVILKDLVLYLQDPQKESNRQQQLYSEDIIS